MGGGVSVRRSVVEDLLSIYLPSFFIHIGMSIVSPILPLYARSFDVSFALASLAISVYAFGRFVVDLPVGLVADRVGRKPLMVAGTALVAVTSFLNAVAGSYAEFLLYRFLQGVGSSMWMTSRSTLLADILRPEERGRVMSYFQAFTLIGASAGPTIGGYVATLWDLRAPFYFNSLMGLVSLIFTVATVHESRGLRVAHRDGRGFSPRTMARILSNRSFGMACLATFTIFFMRTGIRSTMIPLYADAVIGLDMATIGAVLSFATIMNMALVVPVGYAIDYFGRKPPLLLSLAVTALSTALFPFTSDYLQISLAAVLLGIGTSGAGQAPFAMAADSTAHEPHGAAMGLYRLFSDIGFIVGPIVVGFIADGYGLRAPFLFTTALVVASALLLGAFAEETYSAKRNSEKGRRGD